MALNKRGWGQHQWTDPSAMREAVDPFLARDRVQWLLDVRYKEQRGERPLRRDARLRLE